MPFCSYLIVVAVITLVYHSTSSTKCRSIYMATFQGGQTSQPSLTLETLPEGWVCLFPSSMKLPALASTSQWQQFDIQAAYIPDLIQASDVVIGKLGYGMVSEMIALRKPLLYVPRANFIEEPFLRRYYVTTLLCTHHISPVSISGTWSLNDNLYEHGASWQNYLQRPDGKFKPKKCLASFFFINFLKWGLLAVLLK